MKKFIDLTGQKFNRWTFIEYVGKIKNCNDYWKCLCDCGNTKTVSAINIKKGLSKSCGCYNLEKLTKHGYSKSQHPLYRVWYGIIKRCENPRPGTIEDRHYKSKNIIMCPEWRNNPKEFVEWGVANGWEPGLQIDRIDNDGNYCPENCRFVTHSENNRNKSTNRLITYNGKTQCLIKWTEELGLPYNTICNRLHRNWTIEKAFTKPIIPRNQ